MAQNKAIDFQLISNDVTVEKNSIYNHQFGNDSDAMKAKRKNVLAKYNPVQLTFTGLMLFYQRIISPQLSSDCPYELTCSNFSKHAIKEFGLVKGIFLSSDRLLRCNPYNHSELPFIYFDANDRIIETPKSFKWRR